LIERKKLLITGPEAERYFPELAENAELYMLDKLDGPTLDSLLPSIDCILVVKLWPEVLSRERVARMKNLHFIQSRLAGVNHIPIQSLRRDVTICSNAGAQAQAVAEYAWGLLLAAAKSIVKLDEALRSGRSDHTVLSNAVAEIMILKGRSLGVIGYGGIGHSVASIGRAFGMEICAFSRHSEAERGVKVFQGRDGLLQMLRIVDASVISIPLTNKTKALIGPRELSVMKPNAILVNIARAEIVDEQALYDHLKTNKGFTYATDVWHLANTADSYSSGVPFLRLDNFIRTPHVSGPSEAQTGESIRLAVENLLHYLKDEPLRNIVDRSEYL
jgi:phosphoglycerate dehydrogenase-like enzyme